METDKGTPAGTPAVNASQGDIDLVAQQIQEQAIQRQQFENMQRVPPSGNAQFHTQFDMVMMFHAAALEKGGCYIGMADTNVPEDVIKLRIALIEEEVNNELLPLLKKMLENGGASLEQKTELMDHIVDSVYVIMGASVNFGLPFDAGFAIVHNSNMQKIVGPGRPQFWEEGNIEGMPAGKIKKPVGWVPPTQNLSRLLLAAYSEAVKMHPEKQNNLRGVAANGSGETAVEGTPAINGVGTTGALEPVPAENLAVAAIVPDPVTSTEAPALDSQVGVDQKAVE